MFSNQSSEVVLEPSCRVIQAVQGDRVENRWLVGSSRIRQDNHLYVLRYHSEVNELGLDAALYHDTGPVQCLATSPSDPSKFLTAAERSSTATLWQAPSSVMEDTRGLRYDPDEEDALGAAPTENLESLTTLPSLTGEPIVDVVWRNALLGDESDQPGDVLTLDRSGSLTQWDVSMETASSVRTVDGPEGASARSLGLTPRVAWDPHSNGDTVAVTRHQSVHLLDFRENNASPSGIVESFPAHRSSGIMDMDFNPNKPYVLATAGQDGLLKFWDLRSARHPLLVCRGGHSHWIYNVQYNPFHDQLVLSSGTDSFLNLWRVSTISSAPLLTLDDDGEGEDAPSGTDASAHNVRVDRYEHQDSCYAASWGTADAWIYVSVGYEGKAVLHHVSSDEKYKILL
jgi:WD40 repeat protein